MEYEIALYNVWDRHFDDLADAGPDDPIKLGATGDLFDEALTIAVCILNEAYDEVGG